jgi:vancomycin permeability regulator SanA
MSGYFDDGNTLPNGLLTPERKKTPWRWIIFFVSLICFFIIVAFFSVRFSYSSRIMQMGEVMPKPVAIVLGASVKSDGTPSDALMDRLKTGAMLYQYGYTKNILVSGDDGQFHNDEVSVMKKTLIGLGVPEKNIYTDRQGYRTYESCKRAIQTYHISNAIIVTQRFHLPRALFLCNELGLESVGVSADLQTYEKIRSFEFREFFASVKAFIDIFILEPKSPV